MASECIQLIILWLPWQLVCQVQMASSFHSINAVVGLLFPEKNTECELASAACYHPQFETWDTPVVFILFPICSWLVELVLLPDALYMFQQSFSQLPHAPCIRRQLSEDKLSPSLMLLTTMEEKKQLQNLLGSMHFFGSCIGQELGVNCHHIIFEIF